MPALWKRIDKLKVGNWLSLGKGSVLEVKRNSGATNTISTDDLAALDASTRIVSTTSTALSLTAAEHGERMLLVNSNSTVANTFTLPAATGSGRKYTLINNLVQTQGTVVFAALGADVFTGVATAINSTAGNVDSFVTTATSDKMSLNLTTTGGLGGDILEAWDQASGTWYVRAMYYGSGTLLTPWSAT